MVLNTIVFLSGTLDDSNPLCVLRGNALVLSKILGEVDEFYDQHIDRESVSWDTLGVMLHSFPEATGICINMMPIKMHQLHTLPKFCKQYTSMIWACGVSRHFTDYNSVAYLTITEQLCTVGTPHTRPGLHIVRPGAQVQDGTRAVNNANHTGPKHIALARPKHPACYGYARARSTAIGEMFMATNIANYCQIYPYLVKSTEQIVDDDGNLEHMRGRVGLARGLAADELVSFTDRTPLEFLPVMQLSQQSESDHRRSFMKSTIEAFFGPRDDKVYKQFFQLVVGPISVWDSLNNTPNPDGVQPQAPISEKIKTNHTKHIDLAKAEVSDVQRLLSTFHI